MQRILLPTLLASILLLNTGCGAAEQMKTQNDLSAILQQVIDAKQLSGYFHADVLPERVPLRLLRNDWIHEDLKLSKFGEPVEIIPNSETHQAYMIITDLVRGEDSATLAFEYPPEGLTGTAKLSRQNDAWVLDSMTLHEK